jgi:sialic acid synthase SpsE
LKKWRVLKLLQEVGAIHGGDVEIAIKMIEAAAQAGADWFKFQSWQAKNLKPGTRILNAMPTPSYQMKLITS